MFKLLNVPVFILTAVLYAYCFMIGLRTYRQKRKKTALSLLVLFAGCVVINICSAIDGLFYQVLYFDARYGYVISLIFTAIAIIGLLYFATEIFASEATKKPIQVVRLIYSTGFIAIAIWGTVSITPEAMTIPLSVLFLDSLVLYIVLAIRAYGLAKRVEDVYYKKSISTIGHYALGNIGIYIFFILDSIEPALQGRTVWSFIGVCIFALTAYLAYIGFVKPMIAK